MNRMTAIFLVVVVWFGWGMAQPSPAQTTDEGTTYTAAPNFVIPDKGGPVFSSITVPAGTPLENLMVTINIAHNHSSDLRISLSHQGRQVRLLEQLGKNSGFGCSADGLMVSFAYTATQPLSSYNCSDVDAVVTGVWRAEDGFGSFIGLDAGGTWELRVEDVVVSDSGTLRDWSITINADDTQAAVTSFGFTLVNHGEVMILTNAPIPIHTQPMGQLVHDANAQEIWLPRDFDQNGFDTYVVADVIRTEDDGIWLGLFIGNDEWGWVRMEDVIPLRYIDGTEETAEQQQQNN